MLGCPQRRRGLCLPEETLQGGTLVSEFGPQDLQCDLSIQSLLAGLQNDAHSTAADQFDDAVIAQPRCVSGIRRAGQYALGHQAADVVSGSAEFLQRRQIRPQLVGQIRVGGQYGSHIDPLMPGPAILNLTENTPNAYLARVVG